MISYWALLSARFRSLLQYRSAAIAGAVTQVFWGLIRVMIFEAFYRSSTQPQPMNIQDVTTYIWLSQAFLILIPWSLDVDLRNLIRTGGVGYELVRPVDLYTYWYTRAIAGHTAPVALRVVPIILFAAAFMSLQPPASIAAAASFVITLIAAVLLSSAITTFLNITMLWTISGEGVAIIMRAFVNAFSGILVPLPLFPEWSQPVMNLLPFKGIIDAPFRLYMGHIPAEELPIHLAHQLIWIAIMILLGRWILTRGLRKLVVQGG